MPAHTDHTYLDLVEGECTFGFPSSFDEVAIECLAARSGVAIFDQSYFGKFIVEGPLAPQVVSRLCAAPVLDKPVGSISYTPLCNGKGGVEADLTVTRLGDDKFYFAAGGATMSKDLEWIIRSVKAYQSESGIETEGMDVCVRDVSDELTMISVQGPYSRELLEPLITSGHSLSNEAFPFSTHQYLEIAGVSLHCLRLTFVGEMGWELHVPAEFAVAVYDALWERAGTMQQTEALVQSCPFGKGVVGDPVLVRDAGYRAIDSLSADKNYRHWHADLSNRDSPVEAGIGFTVLPRLKKTAAGDAYGAFNGREALEVKRERGARRKLVCLAIGSGGRETEAGGSAPALHGNEIIYRNGVCVGYIRSTAYSHTLETSLAYGYIDLDCEAYAAMTGAAGDGGDKEDGDGPPAKVTNKWLKAGQYELEDRGVRHEAVLHVGAPFDPKNQRIKGVFGPAE